jgi:hypothetical protein
MGNNEVKTNAKPRVVVVFDSETEYQEFEGYAKSIGLNIKAFIKFAARSYIGEPEERDPKDDKTIEVTVNNYRELQGYVEERKLGNVAVFAAFAMHQYMSRNSLSNAQKCRVEERYGISLDR